MATLRLLVDFNSSTNITTREAPSKRSPRLTGQAPPEVMWMVNRVWLIWAAESPVPRPPFMDSSTRL